MIDQPEIRFPPHIVVWPQFSGSSHAPQTSSPAARWVTPTSETLSTPHCSFQGFGLAGGTLEHFDMGGSPAFNPTLNITDKHGTEGGRLTDARREGRLEVEKLPVFLIIWGLGWREAGWRLGQVRPPWVWAWARDGAQTLCPANSSQGGKRQVGIVVAHRCTIFLSVTWI